MRKRLLSAFLPLLATLLFIPTSAWSAKIVQNDYKIDSVDPGIKLFVREKYLEGTTTFTKDNIVVFVHGATFPSTPDFDLQYEDYSWADWMVKRGYLVYLFDKRNYGFSTREKQMDQPREANKPLSRSYLVIRDIGAVVDHIKQKRGVDSVVLIGWSWGAMTAGYYASLHSENVTKLVLFAPAYAFTLHTNLGPGSKLQDKRDPYGFNYGVGAYRLATAKGIQGRWDGEIPHKDKSQYRTQGVVDAFAQACLDADPTSNTRTPPSARAPNGVLEDTFHQLTGRRIWNASSIY
ncbi:MAG: alpha/beta hydrolase, partial [Acidiferrobacterales bacterium]